MSRRYLHFTDLAGAKAISASGELWQSSYGPAGAVFAVVEGSHFVPDVQMSSMGRAKSRNAVVVFETDLLPDYAMPEEVMWHVPKLPIRVIKLTLPRIAKEMLDGSLPEDPETEMLGIELHPAFNVWGKWTRMPDDFDSWVPGQNTEKYMAALELWHESQDVDEIRDVWNEPESGQQTKEHLRFMVDMLSEEFLEAMYRGKETEAGPYFHGTSTSLKIEREILPPNDTGKQTERRAQRLGKVFFTNNIESAHFYARRAVKKWGGNPVVYTIAPKGSIKQISRRWNNFGPAFHATSASIVGVEK